MAAIHMKNGLVSDSQSCHPDCHGVFAMISSFIEKQKSKDLLDTMLVPGWFAGNEALW